MVERTEEVRIAGKRGTRPSASLRKMARKIEISQHVDYTCSFCGKTKMTRRAGGVHNVVLPCSLVFIDCVYCVPHSEGPQSGNSCTSVLAKDVISPVISADDLSLSKLPTGLLLLLLLLSHFSRVQLCDGGVAVWARGLDNPS